MNKKIFLLLFGLIPLLTKAQVTGPKQPEMTGFESISTTDMVNLLTGDLTYSIPIVNVPGPGGGFSMPLSYHAGVKHDQDAGWVGLGWSLNPGVITRDVNQFPDDYCGKIHRRKYEHSGNSGFNLNLYYVQFGGDSEKGFHGSINYNGFGVSFSEDSGLGATVMGVSFSKNSVSAFGISMSKSGVDVDPVGVLLSMTGYQVGSSGLSSGIKTAISVGINYGVSGIMSLASSSNLDSRWTFERNNYIFYSDYKYYLDYTEDVEAYGSLYLSSRRGTQANGYRRGGRNNTFSKKCGADVHISPPYNDYPSSSRPSSIAYDYYNVCGQGISGAIRPFHVDHVPVNIPYENEYRAIVPGIDDKVQFIYSKDLSNYYGFPEKYYKKDIGLNDKLNGSYDFKFPSDFPKNNYDTERDGFVNRKLVRAKHIKWFTYEELKTKIKRIKDDQENKEKDEEKANLIGGFSITNTEGITYHYHLPTFTLTHTDVNSKESDTSYGITSEFLTPVPKAWLITEITGADYYDANNDDIVNEGDYGYWVKFNYWCPDPIEEWAIPFFTVRTSKHKDVNSYSYGTREEWYLESIETASHITKFKKGPREDAAQRYPHPDDGKVKITRSGLQLGPHPGAPVFTDYEWYLGSIENYKKTSGDPALISKVNLEYKYLLRKKWPLIKKGKTHGCLTLKKVHFFKNNSKIMPPYEFEYGSGNLDPEFQIHSNDAWGMYSNLATETVRKVGSNPAGIWSLNKIKTPTGATIGIEYERDTYSSVAGNSLRIDKEISCDLPYDPNIKSVTIEFDDFDARTICSVGQKIIAICKPTYAQSQTQTEDLKINLTVKSVNSSEAVLKFDETDQAHAKGIISKLEGKCFFHPASLRGGDIRVKSLKIKDELGRTTESVYEYSGGVASIEPPAARSNSVFYSTMKHELYDYPRLPIMYSKVINYQKGMNDKFESKTEYQFQTFNSDLIELNINPSPTKNINGTYKRTVARREVETTIDISLLNQHYMIDLNIGSVGALLEKKTYNGSGDLIQKTVNSYEKIGNGLKELGLLTEGSYIFETLENKISGDRSRRSHKAKFKHVETIKKYHGVFPVSTTVYSNGKTIINRNSKFDWVTGNILETTQQDLSTGYTLIKKTVPAYKVYPTMGSKYIDENNKNMLTQEAAVYTYIKTPPFSSLYSKSKVISAKVKTWRNWSNNIWRPHESYAWNGGLLKDGSLEDFDEYNFSPDAQNNFWQKINETTKYSMYSAPLEVKDINDNYAASILNKEGYLVLATATHAKLGSFLATSFEEDAFNINNWLSSYLSSERTLAPSGINAHTGKYLLKIKGGSSHIGWHATGAPAGRYIASVWIHKSSATSTELKVKHRGSILASQKLNLQTNKFGDWVLVNVEFDLPTTIPYETVTTDSNDLDIEIRNNGTGYTYADDLRVQPVEAVVTSYVYDPITDQVTAILDNNNMATKFKHDDTGRLEATYKETPKGFVKISEHKYNFARGNK